MHQVHARPVKIGLAARFHVPVGRNRLDRDVAEEGHGVGVVLGRQRVALDEEVAAVGVVVGDAVGTRRVDSVLDVGIERRLAPARPDQARRADRQHGRRTAARGVIVAIGDLDVLDRPPDHVHAPSLLVLLAEGREAGVGVGVVEEAVAGAARIGDLHVKGADALADLADTRQVQRQALLEQVGAADAQHDLAAELAGRLARHQVDGAADGVLAVQGSLRTAQHFDPLQIDGVEGGAGRFRDRHAVDIHADRLVTAQAGVRRRSQAAHRDQRPKGAADRLVDLDIGHIAADGGNVGDPCALQRLAPQGRDRKRHVDQSFFAALGRNDHVGDAGRLFGRRSFLSHGHGGPDAGQSGARQQNGRGASHASCHVTLPNSL
ncbi:hypothetical protein D3C87_1237280 [compost metagenome]